MNEEGVEYYEGPRILDGINLDADISAGHPVITRRDPADPVNDGSLGDPAYVPSSKNWDGTSF